MITIALKRGARPLAVLAAIFTASTTLPAATINAVADTYLQFNLPDTANGSGVNLALESASTKPALVLFDLTPFAGQTVTGPGTLRLYFESYGLGDTQAFVSLTAYRALVSWNESTTFNTFGPAAGVTDDVDYDTNALGTLPLTFVILNGAMDIPIPAATLQAWIDNSATNFGFFVTGNNPRARSRESGLAPQLLFDAMLVDDENPTDPPDTNPSGVPEPATLSLVAAGLALAAALRRKPKP